MKDKLLVSIKNGDRDAFVIFYEKYFKHLYNFCLKYLHDQAEAEEIVQETFIAIWENRTKIDPQQIAAAYLISIARNKIFDAVKHKYTVIKHRENIKKSFREALTADEELLWNEIITVMLRSLEQLPPRQRQILTLRSQGYSNSEISTILNISQRTVETHFSRGLANLRSIMGSENITLAVFIWALLSK